MFVSSQQRRNQRRDNRQSKALLNLMFSTLPEGVDRVMVAVNHRLHSDTVRLGSTLLLPVQIKGAHSVVVSGNSLFDAVEKTNAALATCVASKRFENAAKRDGLKALFH